MDTDLIRFVWEVGTSLVAMIAFVIAWANRRGEAHKELELRVTTMEEQLQHLPTVRDIDVLRQAVNQDIGQLASQVAGLAAKTEGNTRMVERMNQFLMERTQ